MFGSGSRAGVVVLLLVKRPGPVTDPATIRYHDIGDYLTREQKLETVSKAQLDEIDWMDVTPNEHSDWINQRSDAYLALRPVAVIQGEKAILSPVPLFERSSLGVLTARDAWTFNSSGQKLHDLVNHQAAFYNEQVEAMQGGAKTVARDPKQFKWDSTAERRVRSGNQAEVRSSGFRSAIYRPFFRQHFYMGRMY